MTGALAAVLGRERAIVGFALVVIVALAWAYMMWLAAGLNAPAMSGMDMSGGLAMAPQFAPWTAAHGLFIFAMWSAMMIGMMTPSAAPMILIYTQVARQATTLGRTFASTGWFAAGYLAAWTAFAAIATAAEYALERAALLSPAMMGTSRTFGGAVLIAAGLYQFTPLKSACLAHCRAPLAFVQQHGGFPSTALGSLRLGALHGLYCIGCCWALMLLLFVVGVMNVLWIAGLMAFVLAEKVMPAGRVLSLVAGAAAIAAGAWILA